MDLENKKKYLKYKTKYLSLMELEGKDHDQQMLDLVDLRNSKEDAKKPGPPQKPSAEAAAAKGREGERE